MTQLMTGKKGLIMGVANDHSIAWGIAKSLMEAGADCAFTYQNESLLKRLEPLVNAQNSTPLIQCDVSQSGNIQRALGQVEKEWSEIDFLVHSVAFSDKEELKGRYVDTSLENFTRSMHISCYSFTEAMKYAAPLMKNGGSALTLSYYGAEKVMPFYNVMGVAKAALEASVRYLAADLGPDNIRVNGISAGPMRTLAGSAIGGARKTYKYNMLAAPLRRPLTLEELGQSGLYLLSDMSNGVTGEIHYVDAGFNAIGMLPGDQWGALSNQ